MLIAEESWFQGRYCQQVQQSKRVDGGNVCWEMSKNNGKQNAARTSTFNCPVIWPRLFFGTVSDVMEEFCKPVSQIEVIQCGMPMLSDCKRTCIEFERQKFQSLEVSVKCIFWTCCDRVAPHHILFFLAYYLLEITNTIFLLIFILCKNTTISSCLFSRFLTDLLFVPRCFWYRIGCHQCRKLVWSPILMTKM